ncbi:MAG: hypothetical protein ABH814_03545 [bacterium]
MIELPLTPYFFQKISLYQELMDRELVSDKKLWPLERQLLIWTVKNHQHLASSITKKFVIDRLIEFGKSDYSDYLAKSDAPKVMGNLCQRGFASPVEIVREQTQTSTGSITREIKRVPLVAVDSPTQIVFTPKGLLAGKVLKEIGTKHQFWGKLKYRSFIAILWLSILSLFVLTVAVPILNLIAKCISKLK